MDDGSIRLRLVHTAELAIEAERLLMSSKLGFYVFFQFNLPQRHGQTCIFEGL